MPSQVPGGGGGPAYATTDMPQNVPHLSYPVTTGPAPTNTPPKKKSRPAKNSRTNGGKAKATNVAYSTGTSAQTNSAKPDNTKVNPNDGYTAHEFAVALLKRLGDPVTSSNVSALMAWMRAEGGHWENTARYNPLNTTQDMPGAGSMNSVGVKVYNSWDQGLEATAKTLQNGNYAPILAALKAGNSPGAVLNAVVASPWSSYPNGISLNGAETYGTGPGNAGGTGTDGSGVVGSPDASNPSLDPSLLAKRYGSLAVALDDLSLKKLVAQAVSQGWDDITFQSQLEQTKFYKTHSDAQQNWLLLQATKPAEAKVEIQKATTKVSQYAAAMGVRLNPAEVSALANQGLLNGWITDDTKLQAAIGAHFQMQQAHAQGSAGALQDQFNQLASDYGIKVSDATVSHWIKRNFTGNMTPDDVKSFFEQQAMTMYPGLASQIKAGQTVAQVAGTYRDSMANLLELDPNSIDMFDPTVRKALQYQPDPSKPSSLMPLWQFEQMVRKDPRWLNTQNARDSAMNTGIQVLKDWGFA